MPHDGVTEHNYVLNQVITEARDSRSELCIAWLDLANAFGSVPHEAILEALRTSGVGEAFTAIVRDILSGNSTRIQTSDGLTEPISTDAGVKQGCPLSGLLFNLAIDPVLHELQGDDAEGHHVLAFADDICIIANSVDALDAGLRTANAFATRLTLKFNAGKSKTLHCVTSPALPTSA